jgi:ligand-binding SRPBCC domain-containing protein
MARLSFKTNVDASLGEVFSFVSNPRNLPSIYPPELKLKVIACPQKIEVGSEFSFIIRILNQEIQWKSRITEFKEPNSFTDEAVSSPFIKWVHRHSFEADGEKTLMHEEIEFIAPFGFVGELFSKKFVTSVMEYRNKAIMKVMGKEEEPVFKDPTKISLELGTLISVLFVTLSILIASNISGNLLVGIAEGLLSWVLIWFFSHDLLHLIVGILLGIKFKEYFIGLSNVTRLGIVKGNLSYLLLALGIRIDRKKKYSRNRLAAMFFAGPVASMVLPLFLSTLVIRNSSTVGYLLFAISIANIAFTSYFSPREGCFAKGFRVLKRGRRGVL